MMGKAKQWLQTAGNEENSVTVFVFRHSRIYLLFFTLIFINSHNSRKDIYTIRCLTGYKLLYLAMINFSL